MRGVRSMSDDGNLPVEGAPPESAVAELPPATFGARLKWERERAGLAATDVAARLRLHLNQVRAIEREDLAALPETAYVRGFVRSYARVLNLDAAPLLADLSSRIGTTTPSVVEGMTQHRDYSPVREAAREQTSRRFFIAGAVLVLIALGALGWYATRERSAVAITAPAAPVQVPPPSTATSAPAAVAPVTVPTVTSPPAAEPAVMEPVPPPPLLKLRFSGPSWAEVKDAEGKVLHSQHSVAGAENVIEGTPPFYVVIGDTTKVSVEVRGEGYDLSPHTRQNVARFTVN